MKNLYNPIQSTAVSVGRNNQSKSMMTAFYFKFFIIFMRVCILAGHLLIWQAKGHCCEPNFSRVITALSTIRGGM